MAARGIRPVRLDLTPEERVTLEQWTRRRSTAQALALRARVVLAGADRPDASHGVLADALGVHRATVGVWRQRCAARRLAGRKDDPRVGAPRRISAADVGHAACERAVATTLEPAPPDGTHGSTRGLAQAVGLSRSTVGRSWRAVGLQPHRSETFKLSTDPLVVETVRDIVSLYLAPPARALVLRVDEKPRIQAVEGTAPGPPMRPGQSERRTHDDVRHGTRDLFAALDVRAGTVIGAIHPRHRSEEFRHFLDTVDAHTPPELDLHLILDNAATRKTELVKRWVLKRPRVHLHFDADECLVDQPRRVPVLPPTAPGARARGVREHRRARGRAPRLHRRDERGPKPFGWTRTADEILASMRRYGQRTSGSDH